MTWLIVGISVFCDRPMTNIVNLMDITDRSGAPFTARSAIIQRGKKLGEGAVRELFDITAILEAAGVTPAMARTEPVCGGWCGLENA